MRPGGSVRWSWRSPDASCPKSSWRLFAEPARANGVLAMQHETAGADLLQAAREALLGEVVPGLTGQQRYAALMVANALKMVERELAVTGDLRAADHAVQRFAGS